MYYLSFDYLQTVEILIFISNEGVI
jgi:hypothetical protein